MNPWTNTTTDWTSVAIYQIQSQQPIKLQVSEKQ